MEPGVLRPLRVGETLDVAIKLYRANFLTLVRLVALVVAPAQVVLVLLQSSIRDLDTTTSTDFTGFDEPLAPTGQPEIDGAQFAATMVGFLAISVIGFVSNEIATAASFRAIGAAYLGEEKTWRESLRYAMRRWRSILWLTIAKNFVLMIGFLLCIVPGVYLYGAFAVTMPILMLEGVKGRQALRRSRDLVKGRWRPVAGVLLIATLLGQIISGAIGGLVAAVFFSGNEIASDVATAIGGIVGSALTVPIVAAAVTVLYIDLRVRKEGFDLELLAETVGVDPAGVSVPSFFPEARADGDGGDQPPFWPPPPGWKPRSGA